MQDDKTRNLRLMILWRYLENVVGIGVVLLLPAVTPCTPASSDVRYLSEYCITCCRGPIMYFEFAVAMGMASGIYAVSWIVGWYFDNYYFKTDF